MRKLIMILLLFGFIGPLLSQTLSSDIVFEKRVHDFGTIPEEKGKVSHTFVFQNNGTSAVTINEVSSPCGCIGKIVSTDPVQPGKKGKISITFNPAYQSGFFSKEIIVFSNNGQHFNRIWVEGKIIPGEHPVEDDYPYNFGNGLHLRLKVMALGYQNPGETKQIELHYANDTNKEMILNFALDGKNEGLKFSNPGKIPAKGRGVVNFSYTMPATISDDVTFSLYPYVNNKKLAEKLEIKILHGKKLSQNGRSKQKN